LTDESYLTYPARESLKKSSQELSRPLGLFRQRRQTLIFVVQEGRLVDRNIISSSDIMIFKNPGTMQLEFERPELKKILNRVKEAFDKVKGNKKSYAYVYCPWYEGMVECNLPSYWSEELSRAYAFGASVSDNRGGKVITLQEKKKEAKRLYGTGRYSYQQLAEFFGNDKSTIIYWVKHSLD
jgi:hypothetical protein